MTKKSILTVLLAFVSLTMVAQEKLIRIDKETLEVRNSSPRLWLYYNEMFRLLVAKNAEFGVVITPSNGTQSALSYDAQAKQLVYKQAESSIWKATKNQDAYKAPGVKSYTLAVSAKQAKKLKAMWTDAVGNAVEKEDNMLDGIKWEFFIGKQGAKARTQDNAMVKLTEQLAKAVMNGDAKLKDSLLAE
ncbi:MAG: hypothetical protein IKW98_06980 [Prevotella sp.]|nr:hypothetical protein [Prevotella sp.]